MQAITDLATPDVQVLSFAFDGELVHLEYQEARDQSKRRGMSRRVTFAARDHAEKVGEILELLRELVDDEELEHRAPPAQLDRR